MKCDIFKLWETHREDLKGYVGKRVSNDHDINDILQSVLIKITNYCEVKNDVTYVKSWVYRITHNTIVDFYKNSKRTTSFDFENLRLQSTLAAYNENIYVWLHTFIDNLPVKYAEPLKLSDIEGKPQKEIAKELGLTLVATKSRIQRARKMLKEKFAECGITERSDSQSLEYTVTKKCCLI